MKDLFSARQVMVLALVLTCLTLSTLCPDPWGSLRAEDGDIATVSGTVLDRETGQPLSGSLLRSYIEAIRWDGGTVRWLEGVYSLPVGAADFSFQLKNPGEYYFDIAANGYIHEYYKNARVIDKKMMITVNAGDKIKLDTMYLDRVPVYIEYYKMETGDVGEDGGQVILSADISNSTENEQTVLVWAKLSSTTTLFGSTTVYGALDVGDTYVTIEAKQKTPLKITFDIPRRASPGVYCANLYAGRSKWRVLNNSHYGICLIKTEDSNLEIMPEKVVEEPSVPRTLP